MRALCLVAVAGIVFGLTGCGGGGDLAQQRISAMNELSAALESGDMTAIKAAVGKLKAANGKLKEVTDPAERMRLLEKHAEGLMSAGIKLDAAVEAAEAKMTDEQKAELKAVMAEAKP